MGTVLWVLGGLLIGVVIMRVGVGMLRSLGTPMPGPPPAGEMRRVNLRYRCSLCGTEVRMTSAIDELPEPPRHCMEDMDLLAPKE
jgi:hypothetical protein